MLNDMQKTFIWYFASCNIQFFNDLASIGVLKAIDEFDYSLIAKEVFAEVEGLQLTAVDDRDEMFDAQSGYIVGRQVDEMKGG